jgi:hypothetical protein
VKNEHPLFEWRYILRGNPIPDRLICGNEDGKAMYNLLVGMLHIRWDGSFQVPTVVWSMMGSSNMTAVLFGSWSR